MIRILICDDQSIVCEGLNAMLKAETEIEVVGFANDGKQALEQIEQHHPDLVLMDLKMPIMNGIKATRAAKKQFPEVKVLVLTTYDHDEWVFDAIRSGADGYLLKDTPREQLVSAIRGTVHGDTHVSPLIAGKLFNRVAQSTTPQLEQFESLSERELSVLELLARGSSNQDIADQLHLSPGTVRNYVSNIIEKLGVEDRTQAAVMAISSGLVQVNRPLE
jgi:DNA-binding NarL/FixJ family response regulator